MDRPWISVVIPTRDRPGLVAGAVRSALDQDGVRVEVCVVDDASTEPLVLPGELARDERVAVVRLDSARGPAAARNRGLTATSADLVAFLDDDDVWLPGKLARQVEILRAAGPGTVMVACGFEVWDGTQLVAASVPPAPFVSRAILAHPCIWPSTVLGRRSAIEAAGGFDETLVRVEDWDLWLRMGDLGAIAAIPEVLVDRRWRPLPPALVRSARAGIVPRLEQRIARLAPAEAARLRTRLRADDGVVLARLGRRGDAARLLLRCLRDDPLSRAALRGLARVAAGERVWSAVARAAAPARARLRRRPPRPPGPAPRWAGP